MLSTCMREGSPRAPVASRTCREGADSTGAADAAARNASAAPLVAPFVAAADVWIKSSSPASRAPIGPTCTSVVSRRSRSSRNLKSRLNGA